MKKQNFNIVRYYLNDEVLFADTISKKKLYHYEPFFEDNYINETGGQTRYYRIELDVEKYLKIYEQF